MLAWLGIGTTGVISIGFLIWLFVNRFLRAKKLQGAAEEREQELEKVHDDSLEAKKVEEAARLGTDPDWSKRVHDKYSRG